MPAYFVHRTVLVLARIASSLGSDGISLAFNHPHPSKPLYTFYALDTRTRPLSLLAQISAFVSYRHCFALGGEEESVLDCDDFYLAQPSSSIDPVTRYPHLSKTLPFQIHPYGIDDDYHEPSTPFHHVAFPSESPQPRSLVLLCQRRIRGPGFAHYSTKPLDVVQYEPGLPRGRLDDAARRPVSTV
jgi:hypothetical protein